MLLALLAGPSAEAGAVDRKQDAEGEGQIAAFEHALLPAVLFDNQPMSAWTLPARMARHHVPGVSIALIEDGRIAWSKGYGVTRDGGAAVSPSTPFQAASLAKLMTAVAALRLVERGELRLDGDVDQKLASWEIPANPFTATSPVTLRHLLAHRAGTTVRGFRGYAEGEALPDLRCILAGGEPANSPPVVVDIAPGSVERYSGGGYQVVQQLLEDVTARPFAEVVRQQVLRPAGMSLTVAGTDPPALSACGHGHDGAVVTGCAHRYPETAAAGWWTTPGDLARLALSLSRAYRDGGNDGLLAGATARVMLAPVADGHMGLGPGVHGSGEAFHFDQAGWNRGFRARLIMYPHLGKGIVVMVNGDGGDVLIEEIARAAAHVYQWPGFRPTRRTAMVLDPATLAAWAGEYAMEAGFPLTVEPGGDHLRVRTPRGTIHAFHPLDEGRFVDPEEGAELRFEAGPAGSGATLSLWGMQGRRAVRANP